MYEAGLKKYDYPVHLAQKHLHDGEDNEFFTKLALKAIFEKGSVNGEDYYAETKASA